MCEHVCNTVIELIVTINIEFLLKSILTILVKLTLTFILLLHHDNNRDQQFYMLFETCWGRLLRRNTQTINKCQTRVGIESVTISIKLIACRIVVITQYL